MPKKTVDIGVAVGNNPAGQLSIRVNPWRVDVSTGDTVEWRLVPNNNAKDVKWIIILNPRAPSEWPFDDVPPHPAYQGDWAKPAATPSGRKGGFTGRVRYDIVIGFNDDQGLERVAWIDPDMVMT